MQTTTKINMIYYINFKKSIIKNTAYFQLNDYYYKNIHKIQKF